MNKKQNNKIEDEIIKLGEKKISNEIKDEPPEYKEQRVRRNKLTNDDLETDISLKKSYAYWLIGIMVIQLMVMNRVFLDVGAGLLHYSDFALNLYIAGTLLELFGLVLVITKYLFKK